MIRKGDKVTIKPEWRDQGDDEFAWVAYDDEEKGRVTITPVNTGLSIPPLQTVSVEMLEPNPSGVDNPSCPRCGMYNAMLAHWDSERGEFNRVCRDCGYSPMSKELELALRQVANYLWKRQEDVNEDPSGDPNTKYRIEEVLLWVGRILEEQNRSSIIPLSPLAKRIMRGFVEWRDFYPEGTDGFDEEFVYPIVVKTMMPRLLEEEEEVLSGGGGPEGTFYIALESIVENMQVRGPLTDKTSFGRLTPEQIARQIAMEEWAFVMWTEMRRLIHSDLHNKY